MSRRHFGLALSCTAASLLLPSVAAAQCAVSGQPRGCRLSNNRFRSANDASGTATLDPTLGVELSHTTNDDRTDLAINNALERLSSVSGQRPYFALYNDGDRPNAFATERTVAAGWRGAVLFGRKLFDNTMGDYVNGDIGVLVITAHEFAHISQFFETYAAGTTFYDALLGADGCKVRLSELHADFMAGYYLGRLRLDEPRIRTQGIDMLMRSLGSDDESDPDFHGVPQDRLDAAQDGYELGVQNAMTYRGALRHGAEFVLERFGA